MLWKRGCVLGLQACGLGLGLGGCGLVNITAKTLMILKTDHYHSMSLVISCSAALQCRLGPAGRQAGSRHFSVVSKKWGVRPPPSKKWRGSDPLVPPKITPMLRKLG